MSWQKCPICDGTGVEPHPGMLQGTRCSVCGGAKIIHSQTGKPPTEIKVRIEGGAYDPKLGAFRHEQLYPKDKK